MIVFDIIVTFPITSIPFFLHSFASKIIVARKKHFIIIAKALQRFQFTCHIHLAFFILSNVKRDNTDRIARNQKIIFLLIVERKSKNTIKILKKMNAFMPV